MPRLNLRRAFFRSLALRLPALAASARTPSHFTTLGLGLAAALGLPARQATGATVLDPAQEWLIGGSQFAVPGEGGRMRRALVLMSLQSRQPQLIDTDFFPHGFAIDPRQNTRVASFQKIGPGAALIDLASGRVLTRIAPKGQQQFYGHGVFTRDGKWLLSTERDEATRRGLIAIRDASTLDYLGEFPSHGDSPHDCQLIEDGQVLAVANGEGSVSLIDVARQRLIEKLPIPNKRLNAGHLQMLPQRRLVAVSAPAQGLGEQDLGGISVRLAQRPWSSLSQPQELVSHMVGEALSVAVSPRHGVFAVTHPGADLVSFWSLSDASPLGQLSLPRPRGVDLSLDGDRFLISFGPQTSLALVDAHDRHVIEQAAKPTYFSGSHLLNWSRATRAG